MTRLVLVVIVLLEAAAGCQKERTASLYEIPEGYRGWIQIDFGLPGCPSLEIRDGKYIVPIAKDGTGCTSSAPEYGYAHDSFRFVGERQAAIGETGEGQGGLIWGGGIANVGRKPLERTIVHFFVGTEAEYKLAQPFSEVIQKARAR